VTGKTDYVVAGDQPGTKLEKAKKLNLNILSPQEFFRLINHHPD